VKLVTRHVRFVPLADLADRHRLRKLPTAVEDLGSRRDALRLVLAAGIAPDGVAHAQLFHRALGQFSLNPS
jgi:hypothetical protein